MAGIDALPHPLRGLSYDDVGLFLADDPGDLPTQIEAGLHHSVWMSQPVQRVYPNNRRGRGLLGFSKLCQLRLRNGHVVVSRIARGHQAVRNVSFLTCGQLRNGPG